jgi:two-component system, LytTR family, response regulator
VNPIRAIIVDDEALARAVTREHLAAYPEFDIVAECANGFEAVKAITELQPDVVFLDIQMPKLSGFEVLDLIDHPCEVVFVTAFDEFALRAFEAHAADYLLKPFSEERFARSIARVAQLVAGKAPASAGIQSWSAIVEDARSRAPLERILIRDGTKVTIIPVGDIDYIEAQDDYVRIVAAGKGTLKLDRLSRLETALPSARFIRIHRSYIVNVERVARIELFTRDSRVAILRDGTKLPVSKAGYERIGALS